MYIHICKHICIYIWKGPQDITITHNFLLLPSFYHIWVVAHLRFVSTDQRAGRTYNATGSRIYMVYVWMYLYMYVYVHIYMYVYIYMYAFTYEYIQIQSHQRRRIHPSLRSWRVLSQYKCLSAMTTTINTLQHPAKSCNTLQHPATPCNILRHSRFQTSH